MAARLVRRLPRRPRIMGSLITEVKDGAGRHVVGRIPPIFALHIPCSERGNAREIAPPFDQMPPQSSGHMYALGDIETATVGPADEPASKLLDRIRTYPVADRLSLEG